MTDLVIKNPDGSYATTDALILKVTTGIKQSELLMAQYLKKI